MAMYGLDPARPAGPATKNSRSYFQIRFPDPIFDPIPPHSSLENRSLVDFQEKNEQFIDHGAHFLFENRALVDFQEKNGPMGAILMKMAVFLKGNALRHVENHDMESCLI